MEKTVHYDMWYITGERAAEAAMALAELDAMSDLLTFSGSYFGCCDGAREAQRANRARIMREYGVIFSFSPHVSK